MAMPKGRLPTVKVASKVPELLSWVTVLSPELVTQTFPLLSIAMPIGLEPTVKVPKVLPVLLSWLTVLSP